MKKSLLALIAGVPLVLAAQQEAGVILLKSKDGDIVVTGSGARTWRIDDKGDHLEFKGSSSPLRFDLKKKDMVVTAKRADGVMTKVTGKDGSSEIKFDHGTLSGNVVATQTNLDKTTRVIRSETANVKLEGETWTVNTPSAATVTLSGKADTTLHAGSVHATLPLGDDSSYKLSGEVRVNSKQEGGTSVVTSQGATADVTKATTHVTLPGHPTLTNTDTKSGNVVTLSGVHGEATLSNDSSSWPLRKATFSGGVTITLRGKDKSGKPTNMKATGDHLTYDEATRTAKLVGHVQITGDNNLTYGATTADDVTVEFSADHKPTAIEMNANPGESRFKQEKEKP